MNAFPCPYGTLLLTLDVGSKQGYTATPVLAFVLDPEDQKGPLSVMGRLCPITIHGVRRMVNSALLIQAEGTYVVDPHAAKTFDSPEEWAAHAKIAFEKNPANRAPTKADPEPDDEPELPLGDAPVEEGSDETPLIAWSKRELKNQSFWRYTDSDFDFVFAVPGGEFLPVESKTCQKIKRDEMLTAKKTEGVPEYEFLKVMSGDFEEETSGDEGAAEGGDSDGWDLI